MNDIEKAIKAQQKLITIWEQRIQELEETIKKYPWGRNGLKYDFGDWRESGLLRRKEQIELALTTLSALEKQIPKRAKETQGLVKIEYICPICKRINHCTVKYCWNCGQKLDWSV